MRPTPAEVIAGVRRILRDVVEPDLGSDYTRQRLREVRAVLAQLDWDEAGLRLARDTAALHALLADCGTWVAADGERSAHFAEVLPELTAAVEEPPATLADGFAVHNERYATYAAVAVRLVDPLADWLRDHPDDEAAGALSRRLSA